MLLTTGVILTTGVLSTTAVLRCCPSAEELAVWNLGTGPGKVVRARFDTDRRTMLRATFTVVPRPATVARPGAVFTPACLLCRVSVDVTDLVSAENNTAGKKKNTTGVLFS